MLKRLDANPKSTSHHVLRLFTNAYAYFSHPPIVILPLASEGIEAKLGSGWADGKDWLLNNTMFLSLTAKGYDMLASQGLVAINALGGRIQMPWAAEYRCPEVSMHLTIDGYGSNPDILQSEEFIYQLLDQYPAEIGMTKIAPPYVLRYVGAKTEEWGVSGFVLIAESHISIHTFVERCYVNIDVFSCKSFDADQITRDLSDRLQLTEVKTHLLDRDMVSLSHLDERGEATLLKPQ